MKLQVVLKEKNKILYTTLDTELNCTEEQAKILIEKGLAKIIEEDEIE